MARRIKVLAFTGGYLPGYKYGGPISTVSSLVKALSDALEFNIVTADRDLNDVRPYPNVKIDEWNTVGDASVFYCSRKSRSIKKINELMGNIPHDILYLNSFFNPDFSQKPLWVRWLNGLDRPTIIAPRGEFSRGALELKWWKKKPYIEMVKLTKLYSNAVWQASSEHEKEDILRVMGPSKRVVVAPNLPRALSIKKNDLSIKDSGILRIIFLSRITRKKNLEFALRLVKHVECPIVLDIVGPISDYGYWERIKGLITKMPNHVRVSHLGEVEPSKIPYILPKYDLFLLPTLGENYGHVIAEALSAGLPLLISDQTPWKDLEKSGLGWDVPLRNEEKFRQSIKFVYDMDPWDHRNWRHHILEWAQNNVVSREMVDLNRVMFTNLI